MAGVVTFVIGFLFAISILLPPLKWLLMGNILPNPGSGPSESSMDDGKHFFKSSIIIASSYHLQDF